ncbi:MAG: polysaccharide pyruvyl transferase family protein [Thiomicrospira sp.]|uniref:polysaccharide pyruvyl transferase family protein n=1 Tax=Thiomicrospira sp. TaxID=935 RepID=UPI001A0A00EF|nr:polysaccharide pyruvyl transferase family protein [Thiomicrospira sp.]MBE0494583.1 polysaccharide pyruvyl transferase family protein [Thiomicrospira sp.]
MNHQQIKTVAIINDTSLTNHYGCLLVMENLRGLLEEAGVQVVWAWPVGKDWRKYKRQILNKPKVDLIIVNGEGTIHHSATRKHARALSEFAEFAKLKLDTPSVLINATLYKNQPSLYQTLKYYQNVFVRDRESLFELNQNGLHGEYVPDMTFAKQLNIDVQPTKKGLVIDTALKHEIPKLKAFCKKNAFDFTSMVVARPKNENFFKSPRPFVKSIYKWLTLDRKRSTKPQDYIKQLKTYHVVVTGRYHTVTMCIKHQIPFIAIESNTPKISNLLQDCYGSVHRVINFENLDSINLAEYAFFSPEEQESAKRFSMFAEQSIANMVDSIIYGSEFKALK